MPSMSEDNKSDDIEDTRYRRHWSFVVCDPKYLYPAGIFLLALGVYLSFHFRDPTQVSRVGTFVIGIGVWMTLRYTLREGINRTKNMAASSPVIPGTNQLNIGFFNQISFSIGDAHLQLHGFALVVAGSLVASYGDLALEKLFPVYFC